MGPYVQVARLPVQLPPRLSITALNASRASTVCSMLLSVKSGQLAQVKVAMTNFQFLSLLQDNNEQTKGVLGLQGMHERCL